jgi:hypothetical protein
MTHPLVIIGIMKNAADTAPEDDVVEQLSLLPRAEVPVRFRLPDETRQRGLRHIAEIRNVLAARQQTGEATAATGSATVVHPLPPRRQHAA